MKFRQIIKYILVFCFPYLLFGQLDNAYFSRLKTERVPSEDDISWKQFGPGNAGFSNVLRYHPTNPDVVVMVPDLWVVWQSENNGTSWFNIKDKDSNGEFERLNDLYFSVSNPNVGVALERSQVWKTDDMGHNWSIVQNCPWYTFSADGSDGDGWRSKTSALGIDPTDENTWYVGAGTFPRGFYAFSAVAGKTTAANPLGDDGYLMGKVWKTTNAGVSWTEISTGIDSKAQFSRIIINPMNTQQVFAASNYGLYRSNNGGTTWENIGATRLTNNMILDMDYYYDAATNNFTLYVIDQVRYQPSGSTTTNTGGIFKTTDGGETFEDITGDLYIDINQLTGGVPDNYYKYIAKWFGITEASAKSTYPVLPTNALQYFNSVNVDPSRPDALYVGFNDAQIQLSITPGRLWQTADGGSHWVNIARDFGPAWEKDKAYWQSRNNPFNDNMEMGHEPFFQQWGQNYPLRSLRACAVNSRGDVMIIAAHNTLLSTDKGVTFQQVDEDYTNAGNIMGRGNSNLPGESMHQDKRLGPDKPLLGSGEHRLWIPTDDGTNDRQATKQLKNSTETISSIATHPLDENIIFTTSFRQHRKEKIMRSTDGGTTFEEWGEATPAEWQMRTHALTIDPKNPDIMYFGISDKNGADFGKTSGFYFSNDGGKTFTPRNNGLPTHVRVTDIAIDPRDTSNKSLFIAAQRQQFNNGSPQTLGGLYHTNNLGESWTSVNVDPKVNGVNRLKFDTTDRLYITSGHRNNPNDNGGIWYSDDFGTTWTRIFDNARTILFDISPFDNNILMATIGFLQLNPGIYLSEDRGLSWKKNNIDGLNTEIKGVEFDLFDPTKLWSVSMGNGFNLGNYPNGTNAQALRLTPYTAGIRPESIIKLTPEILNSTYSAANIVWKSSNTSIATVDQSGFVTGVSDGKAIITALIDGRYSDSSVIVVNTNLPAEPVDPSNLPIDNYKIQSLGLTCPNADNGKIIIDTRVATTYELNITGDGVDTNYDFTEEIEVTNLKPGLYSATITIKGNTDYKVEFDIVIEDVAQLGITSKVLHNSKQVALSLSGSDTYIIELNGETLQTSDNNITLDLNPGSNSIQVKTDKDCQGTFSKQFHITSSFTISPNPVETVLNINANVSDGRSTTVYLFDALGKMVKAETVIFNGSEGILNVSDLSKGFYFIKIRTSEFNETLKLVKK